MGESVDDPLRLASHGFAHTTALYMRAAFRLGVDTHDATSLIGAMFNVRDQADQTKIAFEFVLDQGFHVQRLMPADPSAYAGEKGLEYYRQVLVSSGIRISDELIEHALQGVLAELVSEARIANDYPGRYIARAQSTSLRTVNQALIQNAVVAVWVRLDATRVKPMLVVAHHSGTYAYLWPESNLLHTITATALNSYMMPDMMSFSPEPVRL